jgi:hypothetical protein
MILNLYFRPIAALRNKQKLSDVENAGITKTDKQKETNTRIAFSLL